MAVFGSVYYFLSNAGLYFFVHTRIGDASRQAVGPSFSEDSDTRFGSLVMIVVVETSNPLYVTTVDGAGGEVLYRGLYGVVVVRKILITALLPPGI